MSSRNAVKKLQHKVDLNVKLDEWSLVYQRSMICLQCIDDVIRNNISCLIYAYCIHHKLPPTSIDFCLESINLPQILVDRIAPSHKSPDHRFYYESPLFWSKKNVVSYYQRLPELLKESLLFDIMAELPKSELHKANLNPQFIAFALRFDQEKEMTQMAEFEKLYELWCAWEMRASDAMKSVINPSKNNPGIAQLRLTKQLCDELASMSVLISTLSLNLSIHNSMPRALDDLTMINLLPVDDVNSSVAYQSLIERWQILRDAEFIHIRDLETFAKELLIKIEANHLQAYECFYLCQSFLRAASELIGPNLGEVTTDEDLVEKAPTNNDVFAYSFLSQMRMCLWYISRNFPSSVLRISNKLFYDTIAMLLELNGDLYLSRYHLLAIAHRHRLLVKSSHAHPCHHQHHTDKQNEAQTDGKEDDQLFINDWREHETNVIEPLRKYDENDQTHSLVFEEMKLKSFPYVVSQSIFILIPQLKLLEQKTMIHAEVTGYLVAHPYRLFIRNTVVLCLWIRDVGNASALLRVMVELPSEEHVLAKCSFRTLFAFFTMRSSCVLTHFTITNHELPEIYLKYKNFFITPNSETACDVCGKKDAEFLCGHCEMVVYCSRECQTKDWKKMNHKTICPLLTLDKNHEK
jgi:hypothetical protein